MTTLSAADLARDLSAQPETKATCDADGNWRETRVVRIRDGSGWREYPVIETVANVETRLIAAVQEALEGDAA